MRIWGKEITSNVLKELCLLRGLIPKDIDAEVFDLSIVSAYKEASSPNLRFNDEFVLSTIKQQVAEFEVSSVDAYSFDWLDPRTKHHYGISTPYDFGGHSAPTFANFMKCRFGAKIPASLLDPGIALLVKTFPLIGVLTSFSCAGHLQSPPVVRVRGKYHLQWLKCVLMCLYDCTETELSTKYSLSLIDGLVFVTSPEDVSSHHRAYWQAQELGRFFLQSRNTERIRDVKFSLKTSVELFDTEKMVKNLKKNVTRIRSG